MKPNMGTIDKAVRIIAALVIGQVPPWQTIPAIVLLMIGMFFVVTGYKTK